MRGERKEGETRAWKRFEDLIAWQKARALTRKVYEVSATTELCRDYGLRDQMRRAAVSVMSNIAEGLERGSQAELHRFLVIAKGSCAELRSQLYVALDVGYLDERRHAELHTLAEETARVLGGLRLAVKGKLSED